MSNRPAARRYVGAGGQCTAAVAHGAPLANADPAFTNVGAAPFGIAAGGRFAFVAWSGGVIVARIDGSKLTPVRTFRTHQPVGLGVTLTPNGRYLLISDWRSGAVVVSVARAESGAPRPVLGALRSRAGGGAIEVATSADGRYAFVSLEGSARIAVYDLQRALADGFRHGSLVGSIPVGLAPVGLALSPDGRWLYATSEDARGRRDGTLSVIDVARAERDPAHSVVATADAHCSPVRVAVSADGSVVWVTARGSDQLLAYSAASLRTAPSQALLGAVRVGESPVGLKLINHDREVVVGDSNRFGATGAHSDLTVVSAAAALHHRQAVLGTVPAGLFPREMALANAGRTLLVGNYESGNVETLATARLR